MIRIHAVCELVDVAFKRHETLTLKGKVGKEGDIFRALLGFRQLCKHQETPPSPALSKPNTLQSHSQGVQETLSHSASLHHAHGSEMLEANVDP